MTVQAGITRQLKDALVAILQTVQYGGEPAFVSVLDNTHDEFSGFPAALVLPDKITSVPMGLGGQMEHTAAFEFVTHIPVASPSDVEQTQYNTMYDLTDLLQNAIESGFFTNALSQQIAGFASYNMTCKQAVIRPVQSKIGPILLSRLNIEITYSQDV
jgi:hypothetical protein